MLKEEHADVTISKIRFLESQGLIDPERTPSGYRKFYDADIERLRWILVQQRDNFLPLKVIKRRLDDAGFDPAADPPVPEGTLPEPTLFSRRDDTAAPAVESGDPFEMPAGSVSLSALELAESTGVDLGLIADLERLGLIETVAAGDGPGFDHEALVRGEGRRCVFAAAVSSHGICGCSRSRPNARRGCSNSSWAPS